MKSVFKQISKKAVSVVLALAVILSSLTVMMSAFAEPAEQVVEPYFVSDGAPAIPMFAGKIVKLNELEIEFSDGTVKAGDTLDWKIVDGSNVKILGQMLNAVDTGITKLTASYVGTEGKVTKNVYVIVNEEGNYDFVLVNKNLKGGYDANEWSYHTTAYLTHTTTPYSFANNYFTPKDTINADADGNRLSMGANGIMFFPTYFRAYTWFYKSDILKDFGDYEINVTVKHGGSNANYAYTQNHLIARATLDETEGSTQVLKSGTTPLGLGYYRQGGLHVYKLGDSAAVELTGSSTTTMHSLADSTLLSSDPEYVWDSALGDNLEKIRNVKYTLQGNHITYSMDGHIVFDSNDVLKTINGTTYGTLSIDDYNAFMEDTNKKGTIGFSFVATKAYLRAFKVSLVGINENTIPEMTDADFYVVKDASPAIPMFKDKQIDLNNVIIEFTEGTEVLASALDWEIVSGNSVQNINNKLWATKTGTTVFKITHNGVSKNFYVIVNETGNYDFVLIDETPNSANYDENDWSFHTSGYLTYTTVPYSAYNSMLDPRNVFYDNTADGGTEKARNYWGVDSKGINFGNTYFRFYTWMYKSELLKEFADYTVKATIQDVEHGEFYNYTQIHFIARATLDESADSTRVMAANQTALGLGIYRTGGLHVYKIGENEAVELTGSATKTVHSLDDSTLLGSSTSNPSYVWDRSLGSNALASRNFAISLQGNRITYSLDNNLIFDSDSAINTLSGTTNGTVSAAAYNAFMNGARNKGTIGFAFAAIKATLQNFKVLLAGTTEETMPTMKDIEASDYAAAANTRIRLSDMAFDINGARVSGSEIEFAEARNEYYQIVDGYFLAFKEGAVALSGTYNGESVNLDYIIKPKGSKTLSQLKVFADDNMTVAPVLDDETTYTVIVDENDASVLEYGTLKLSADNMDGEKVINGDVTGKKFTFNTVLPETMELSANMVDSATRETTLYPMYQGINLDKSAMRFVTRVPQIKKSGDVGVLVDGYSAVGALIIPVVLFDSSLELPSTAEELAEDRIAIGTLDSTGERYKAQNVKFNRVKSLTEAYSDISAALINIPEEMFGIEIMTIPYLVKSDGSVVYPEIYNNKPYEILSDSVNGIIDKAYPAMSDSDKVIENEELYKVFDMIGTDNEYDLNENTSAISYGLNEDITFKLRLAGQYKVLWKLYIDNDLVDSGEGGGQKGDILTVETKLTKAGVASLVLEVYDAYGQLITFSNGENTFTISAAADYQNVGTLSSKEMSESDVSEFYSAFVSDNSSIVDKISTGIQSDSFKIWLGGDKTTAFAYSDGDKKLFSVSYVGTEEHTGIKYDKYNVTITADNALGLASAFAITVPQIAVSHIYDVSATFNDYGVTTPVYNFAPNTISMCVLSDGTVAPNNATQIKDTYEYNVILRDYLAMQFAKSFPSVYGGGVDAVTTKGDGFGGWRAVLAASYSNADVCYADNVWLGGTTDIFKPLLTINAIKLIDNSNFTLNMSAVSVSEHVPLWNMLSMYNSAPAAKLSLYHYGLAANFEYSLEDNEYCANVQKILPEQTITESDLESVYRDYTDDRIEEIRDTFGTYTPSSGGKTVYVSNSTSGAWDSKEETYLVFLKRTVYNDGTDPNAPIKTLKGVADSIDQGKISAGSVICLKRGDTWREILDIRIADVTICTYGEGEAPVITASPANSASSSYWSLVSGTENIYVYKDVITAKDAVDIGSIVFKDANGNESYAFKSVYHTDSTTPSNPDPRLYVNSYADLSDDLQMYHDYETGKVYLCSTKGNPGDRFTSIEMIGGAVGMIISTDNVTVDGICFKYCFFGISASDRYNKAATTGALEGLTVKNCEFSWIGGNINFSNSHNELRYGNGLEVWGGAINFNATNNYFYQNYDAGLTFQWADKDATVEDKPYPAENIYFNDNVFDNCNYSIEYWLTVSEKLITNFQIKNNLCWYSGIGLCSQRKDGNRSAHIQSSDHANHTAVGEIVIENNLFALGKDQLCYVVDDDGIGAIFNNNVYAQYSGKRVGSHKNYYDQLIMDKNVKENLPIIYGDNNAKIITVVTE